MNAAALTSPLSAKALARMSGLRGEPFFLAGWKDAVFLHFDVRPEHLRPFVPFELDLNGDGTATVSCVAFTMCDLRPRHGGAWLFKPIATHEFLNVRTYVKHGGVPGIYFLAEWLPNPLSVLLGPALFGLPYRLGGHLYDHVDPASIRGTVTNRAGGRQLQYEACVRGEPANATADTREEYLFERYTAFTHMGGISRCFHVWHPPWTFTELDARLIDLSLLDCTGSWARHAWFSGAHIAKGFEEVWMGRPRLALQTPIQNSHRNL